MIAWRGTSETKKNSARLEYVVDDKVTADYDEQERHVNPTEESELPAQVGPRKVGDESNESCEERNDESAHDVRLMNLGIMN